MEDNEDADSKKSEAPNLGKLEYSLDYDFQKQEVGALASEKGLVRSTAACLAQSGGHSSSRVTRDGHEWHIRSLRESLCLAG